MSFPMRKLSLNGRLRAGAGHARQGVGPAHRIDVPVLVAGGGKVGDLMRRQDLLTDRRERRPVQVEVPRPEVAAQMPLIPPGVVGGAAVLLRVRRAAGIYLPAAGMLLYSVIVSPGYFAQQGKWPPVAMFVVLLVLTLISMAAVMRSEGS